VHPIKIILLTLLTSSALLAVDYSQKSEVKAFIQTMNEQFHYNSAYLEMLFKQVRANPRIATKTKKKKPPKPHSKTVRPQGSWEIYARLHLEQNQTELGAMFMQQHHESLQRAYQTYGVPPEYITAVIGIESYYGKNRGRYYVFDTLTHLAFDNHPRSKFYRRELQEFLRMCYREGVEPRAIKGSQSGAIGLAQFMPSNYQHYAVDFNHDQKIRISTPDDAIGSIANYLRKNGWRRDEPIGIRVHYSGNRFHQFKTGYRYRYSRKNLANIYPHQDFDYHDKVMLIKLEREKYDELWYGTHNFYVLTRYNHSDYYAMAVHQLAQRIKQSYLAQYAPPTQEQEPLHYALNN